MNTLALHFFQNLIKSQTFPRKLESFVNLTESRDKNFGEVYVTLCSTRNASLHASNHIHELSFSLTLQLIKPLL